MESLQYFEANLSGPATRETPFTGDNDEDKAVDAECDKGSDADFTHKMLAIGGAAEHQMH